MSIDILENLKDVVAVQVATDKSKLVEILVNNKIVITIVKGPQVLTKMVEVGKVRGGKKRASISEETVQKIKTAKKMMKGNIDMIYLFTLLAKLEEYTTKVDMKDLTPEAQEALKVEFDKVIGKMNTATKQLVHK